MYDKYALENIDASTNIQITNQKVGVRVLDNDDFKTETSTG